MIKNWKKIQQEIDVSKKKNIQYFVFEFSENSKVLLNLKKTFKKQDSNTWKYRTRLYVDFVSIYYVFNTTKHTKINNFLWYIKKIQKKTQEKYIFFFFFSPKNVPQLEIGCILSKNWDFLNWNNFECTTFKIPSVIRVAR